MSKIVTIALVGAGDRGFQKYATWVHQNPDKARIVAVAEPREFYREEARKRHDIAPDNVFTDWRELIEKPRLADAVIVATQDSDHVGPATALMELGYDVLLEKPMAPNEADCRKIIEIQKKTGVFLAVCHVLRYSPYFRKLKEIAQSGVLGQITTVRHIEQVGYWHFAHSYVRGNWRNEALSSPVILAKCCHDLDILGFILGKRCLSLASYGHLSHFRTERKPSEATPRCLDCPLADGVCPYSAKSFYFGKLRSGETGWPLNVITPDLTEAGVERALREGPYGRCVYGSDNDVVDHQVVSMRYEDEITVDFTMTAFSKEERRFTEVLGSHGELRGDSRSISLHTFADGKTEEFTFQTAAGAGKGGHLGGDAGMMTDFITAVRERNPALISSGPDISLDSHLMAFAAERSRKTGLIVPIER